jgi:hypothetical protein
MTEGTRFAFFTSLNGTFEVLVLPPSAGARSSAWLAAALAGCGVGSGALPADWARVAVVGPGDGWHSWRGSGRGSRAAAARRPPHATTQRQATTPCLAPPRACVGCPSADAPAGDYTGVSPGLRIQSPGLARAFNEMFLGERELVPGGHAAWAKGAKDLLESEIVKRESRKQA